MIKDRPVPNFIAKRMYERHSIERLENELKFLNSGIIKKGHNILDLGCGPGHLVIEMARITGETGMVYALDIHPLSIKYVEDLMLSTGIKNIETILTRTLDTGLKDKSLDTIFLFNSYDMIRDKKKLYQEIRRVLKSQGILIISNKRNLLTSSKRYKRIFDKDETISYEYQKGNTYFYKKT